MSTLRGIRRGVWKSQEARLITEIKKHPSICERDGMIKYGRSQYAKSWVEVSEQLGLSIESCTEMWRSLEKNYLHIMKALNQKDTSVRFSEFLDEASNILESKLNGGNNQGECADTVSKHLNLEIECLRTNSEASNSNVKVVPNRYHELFAEFAKNRLETAIHSTIEQAVTNTDVTPEVFQSETSKESNLKYVFKNISKNVTSIGFEGIILVDSEDELDTHDRGKGNLSGDITLQSGKVEKMKFPSLRPTVTVESIIKNVNMKLNTSRRRHIIDRPLMDTKRKKTLDVSNTGPNNPKEKYIVTQDMINSLLINKMEESTANINLPPIVYVVKSQENKVTRLTPYFVLDFSGSQPQTGLSASTYNKNVGEQARCVNIDSGDVLKSSTQIDLHPYENSDKAKKKFVIITNKNVKEQLSSVLDMNNDESDLKISYDELSKNVSTYSFKDLMDTHSKICNLVLATEAQKKDHNINI